MKINRPKIPTQVEMMGFLGYNLTEQNFNIFSYLEDTNLTGISVLYQNVAGYQIVFDRMITGWVDFLCIAAKNDAGAPTANSLAYRIWVNDVLVTDDGINALPGREIGSSIVGSIMCTEAPPRRVKAIATGYFPYDRLTISVFNGNDAYLETLTAIRAYDQKV